MMDAIRDETAFLNVLPAAEGAQIDVEKLYLQHRQHLIRFVQRYVRQAEDAEDIVQNAFIEAIRCADRFSGLSKPSTWLFGIALNLARNHVRRNCASMTESLDEALMQQIIDFHADPAVLFEMREIAGKVESLLNTLHPDIRMTFEAVLHGACTYQEAADLLNIPVGTVRSRVSRVRSAVRAECGED